MNKYQVDLVVECTHKSIGTTIIEADSKWEAVLAANRINPNTILWKEEGKSCEKIHSTNIELIEESCSVE